MKHNPKQKHLNKNFIFALFSFLLGTFGISPIVKDSAASQLGMHNYLLFSLVIGCVCLVIIPLLTNTITSSKH